MPTPRSSLLATAVVAAGAGAAAAFLFGTTPGARTRAGVADRARWVRDRSPEVTARLARIEAQLDALGSDLRRRLDTLQQGAADAVSPSFDAAEPWGLDRADLRDLPGLPRG